MRKKYKLTDETIKWEGKTLYRIECIKPFDFVKIGDKGGFVESEKNLSQKGSAWVYDNAKVFDNAVVKGDAQIKDNVCVYDNAKIHGDAQIRNNVQIWGNAQVYGDTYIQDKVSIYDNAKIYGDAVLEGAVIVCDYAKISGHAFIKDSVRVQNTAKIHSNALIAGDGCIGGDAEIKDEDEYCTSFLPGFSYYLISAYKSQNNTILVSYSKEIQGFDCYIIRQILTLEDFIIEVSKEENPKCAHQCKIIIEWIKAYFNIN